MTYRRFVFNRFTLAITLSWGLLVPQNAYAQTGSTNSEPATVATQAPDGPLNKLKLETYVQALPAKPQSDPKLQGIEQRMRTLQGQIQDLKSRILTLGEDISKGFVTGTKLLIVHDNNLGSAFEIESIEYKLDGFTVYTNSDPKRIGANRQLVVFDASVLPGNHQLEAVYTLRATGYGVFTYMEQYSFDMRSQYHFSTPQGQAVELNIEAVDQGSSKNLRERPALRFAVR